MLSSNERIDQETALKTFDLYAVGWLLDKRETIRSKTAQLYAGIIDQHFNAIPRGLCLEGHHAERGQGMAALDDRTVPRRDTTGETRMAQAYRLLHAIMATAVRD